MRGGSARYGFDAIPAALGHEVRLVCARFCAIGRSDGILRASRQRLIETSCHATKSGR